MKNIIIAISLCIGLGAFYYVYTQPEQAQQDVAQKTATPAMSFFITSVNPGNGGDLGGLAGADAYCTTLAESVGVTGKTWSAYLSSPAVGETPAVHARERIGSGPWYNAAGVMIASNVDELHGNNNLTKETALSESGAIVFGRGDTPNMHDILTGSTAEGYLSDGTEDTTCNGWTSSTEGSALVGHHDRVGRDESAPMKSWNSAHPSRGCSLEGLKSTGGTGLFYCFAR